MTIKPQQRHQSISTARAHQDMIQINGRFQNLQRSSLLRLPPAGYIIHVVREVVGVFLPKGGKITIHGPLED